MLELNETRELKGCTLITNELLEEMVLDKPYDLDDIYEIVEDLGVEIDDYKHKTRAVLEKRVGKYVFVRVAEAEYSLKKVKEVA